MKISVGAVALLAVAALGAPALAEDPASLVLAREAVDACRGKAHRAKMRVDWPAMDDEPPPDGAEVVLVSGYVSYTMSRMVLRDGRVQATAVTATRSWFYNQDRGESFDAAEFDVDAQRFILAWNAMRRILAASDVRVAPEPEDHPNTVSLSSGSHESADWIRVRAGTDAPPVHCAGRPSVSHDWDDVRRWEGLRDEAVLQVFRTLLSPGATTRRRVAVSVWSDFATAAIRRVAEAPDSAQFHRDREFIDTCLRVLGEGGEPAAEDAVAAFVAATATLGDGAYWAERAGEEAALAATRLRVRHHWNREDVVRTLRTMEGGTWAREDQAKWLRRTFREMDPPGWARFVVEECTRAGARPDDVVAAAAALRDLPVADALPLLRSLLGHEAADIRLEAALALHEIDPDAPDARGAVVQIALDRSNACGWRPDLTNRWSRIRALAAALEWGALSTAMLRAHVIAPEPDDPAFLSAATARLARTPDALTEVEVRDAWRRLLDSTSSRRILAAVRFLEGKEDVESKERMLAALDGLVRRIEEEGETRARARADVVARWRARVLSLRMRDDAQ